jgi:hypothetical protein
MPHKTLATALVCSCGPDTRYVKEGDRVAFHRLFFAWWKRFPDDTLLGWVDEDNLFGFMEPQQLDWEEFREEERARDRARGFSGSPTVLGVDSSQPQGSVSSQGEAQVAP